jgi:hypothetical protein
MLCFIIMTLPNDEFPKFHSDRLSFKLYACEQHLKNLKYMESRYGELSSATKRLSAEMEIDSFLFQMIGTVNSLLARQFFKESIIEWHDGLLPEKDKQNSNRYPEFKKIYEKLRKKSIMRK